jgi:phage terminase large subunit
MQIYYGGASSGKSVSIAQRDVLDCVNECRNFLITRAVGNTLRSSVFEERVKVINQFKLRPLFDIRENKMEIIYAPRGNRMIFRGLDDVEKLKSITVPIGTLTDLRVEEATETTEADCDQLILRTARGLFDLPKRMILSFNPVMRTHWICKKYFNGQLIKYFRTDKLLIFHSTHRDNSFLSADDHDKIESTQGYMHDVYADGKWGILGDLIFTNWETADIEGVVFDSYRYGLDFGFSVDPSAVIEVAVSPAKKTLYITKELYIKGATNDVLAEKARPIVNDNTVWCDCAEPKSIAELRNARISAYPVSKGKDSVWHSIQWLQQWHIVINRRCYNTIGEFSQYQWQKDKHGTTLPEPVGTNDHIIAALRYATERDRIGAIVVSL